MFFLNIQVFLRDIQLLIAGTLFRRSHPEVFLVKGALKICSRFTGEHPTKCDFSSKQGNSISHIAQKIKFSIKDYFSKCDQIRSFWRIWSYLLKKSLMENFFFCAVTNNAFHTNTCELTYYLHQ